jgi:hypothetical protein
MHEQLRAVFAWFPEPIAIIGSAVYDLNRARDIDVMFLATENWPALMMRERATYVGWDGPTGHVRRANVRIPSVDKPVQLIQNDRVREFTDLPHATLLRDDTVLNPTKFFQKER